MLDDDPNDHDKWATMHRFKEKVYQLKDFQETSDVYQTGQDPYNKHLFTNPTVLRKVGHYFFEV